eukprot:Amastigsp_a325_18.p1 type:complete len:817 gc:universal Amastigsp_a325_18:46-2496(+)
MSVDSFVDPFAVAATPSVFGAAGVGAGGAPLGATAFADSEISVFGHELQALPASSNAVSEAIGAPGEEMVDLRLYELGDDLQCEVRGVRIAGVDFTHQDKSYESFQSIDWLADDARERAKLARMSKGVSKDDRAVQELVTSFRAGSFHAAKIPRLKLLAYNMQGWVCAILCGILCGLLSSFVAVTGGFLADFREGYCSYAFWTPKRTCCLLGETFEGCAGWVSWAEFFGAGDRGLGAGAYFVNYIFYIGISVGFAVLASFLTSTYAPYASGSGIPHIKVILSGFVIRKQLGKWTLGIKTLALPFAVASGLNLGKEGPFVHLAACVGNIMCYFFPKYEKVASKRRGMIASVACAGVCVAFGAPIGGVVFVLEELAYYFPAKVMWRGFVCSLAAAATLAFLDPFHTGKLVLFQLSSAKIHWSWLEFPAFVLIGVLGGLFGAFFCKFNMVVQEIRKHTVLKAWGIREVAVVAFVSALMNYLNIFMRMDGIALLSLLFKQCSEHSASPQCEADHSAAGVVSLLLAAALKMVMMCFTNGLKIPAGLFVPSMAAGACFGRATGAIVKALILSSGGLKGTYCVSHAVCVDTSLYAICGAAAAIGGVTRMTLCLVVIMFEVTGGVTLLIPLMVSVGIAKVVADLWGEDDIYARMIKISEFPFLDPKHGVPLHVPIDRVLKPAASVVTIPEHGATISSLAALLKSTKCNGFPVVTADRGVVGYVSRIDLSGVISRAAEKIDPDRAVVFSSRVPSRVYDDGFLDMRPYMDPTPVCVLHSTPFSTVCDVIRKTGARYLLVLEHGKLRAIVTRKDLMGVLTAYEHSER